MSRETIKKEKAEHESADSGRAQAKRLRAIREYLRYSRAKFAEKYKDYGITESALETWELTRWSGISNAGVRKLVLAFRDEGLPVSAEWLVFGVGEDPLKNFKFPEPARSEIHDPRVIIEEIKQFHQRYHNTIDAQISDDGLSPWLNPGDFVAGERLFGDEIHQAIDQVCIAQLEAGHTLTRWVRKGSKKNSFALECSNPKTSVKEKKIDNAALISVAPIVWVRKVLR